MAISFAAGLIYLVKAIDQSKRSARTVWLEIVMFALIAVLGFVVSTTIFSAMDYKASFNWVDKRVLKRLMRTEWFIICLL